MQETNVIFNPTFVTLKFNVLTSMHISISSNHSTICGLKSPLLIDACDFERSLLHVIFDLKGVADGKEYISINHLLLLLYNIDHFPTLLNERVITR
jgi:hypothetical protein